MATPAPKLKTPPPGPWTHGDAPVVQLGETLFSGTARARVVATEADHVVAHGEEGGCWIWMHDEALRPGEEFQALCTSAEVSATNGERLTIACEQNGLVRLLHPNPAPSHVQWVIHVLREQSSLVRCRYPDDPPVPAGQFGPYSLTRPSDDAYRIDGPEHALRRLAVALYLEEPLDESMEVPLSETHRLRPFLADAAAGDLSRLLIALAPKLHIGVLALVLVPAYLFGTHAISGTFALRSSVLLVAVAALIYAFAGAVGDVLVRRLYVPHLKSTFPSEPSEE